MKEIDEKTRIHKIKRKFFSHENGDWRQIVIARNDEDSRLGYPTSVITYAIYLLDSQGKKEFIAYLEFDKAKADANEIANEVLKILHENMKGIHSDYGIKMRKNLMRVIGRVAKSEKSFAVKLDDESVSFL